MLANMERRFPSLKRATRMAAAALALSLAGQAVARADLTRLLALT
jgi:hypothetical protein